MADDLITAHPIGSVTSPLRDVHGAPRQPDEGAPPAVLVLDAAVRPAVDGLRLGDRILVLTWLHQASRDVLTTQPRDDPRAPLTGVFATRSPHRPNPIGVHEVEITSVDGPRVGVAGLEALDGTPILDIKPVLGSVDSR